MRKIKSIFILVGIISVLFSGCAKISHENTSDIKIITTSFPAYDWAKQIVGEENGFNISQLSSNGVDMHSFQPSASDIAKITDCDVLIYIGGNSDNWIEDALKNSKNSGITIIKLSDVLGDRLILDDHGEMDEHIWSSIKNAEIICKDICEKLSVIAKDKREIFRKNTNSYIKKLNELDKDYESAVNKATVKYLIFGDRFAFSYLTNDYKINYYAAFEGCSAETEASFETITNLSKKADEENIRYIITIDNSDKKIAKTIIDNSKNKNCEILTLNSMQSISNNSEETYLSIMENNLDVLRKALGSKVK